MGVSENVVYPIVPNGFADHYPVFKWLFFIGNINPTFSDKPMRQTDHFCWIVSANNHGIAIHGDGFAGPASNLGDRNFRDGDQ